MGLFASPTTTPIPVPDELLSMTAQAGFIFMAFCASWTLIAVVVVKTFLNSSVFGCSLQSKSCRICMLLCLKTCGCDKFRRRLKKKMNHLEQVLDEGLSDSDDDSDSQERDIEAMRLQIRNDKKTQEGFMNEVFS